MNKNLKDDSKDTDAISDKEVINFYNLATSRLLTGLEVSSTIT